MPRKPTAIPAAAGPRGVRLKNSAPKIPAKKGVAPLSRPVTAELMCSSASGNNVKGMATHTKDRARTVGQSRRSIFVRAPGSTARAPAPSPTRAQVISPGWKSSRAIAMSRNDEPQMAPMATNSPQSRGANGSRSERTGVSGRGPREGSWSSVIGETGR
jgi:hypothetical protein